MLLSRAPQPPPDLQDLSSLVAPSPQGHDRTTVPCAQVGKGIPGDGSTLGKEQAAAGGEQQNSALFGHRSSSSGELRPPKSDPREKKNLKTFIKILNICRDKKKKPLACKGRSG